MRHMTWLGALDVLRQDVRYAWRAIARTPGFALLVVLTFTLGLGVNAATFAVLDTLFLRPPDGVVRPSELRRIWQSFRGEGGVPFFGQGMSGPQYRALAELTGPEAPMALYGRADGYRLGGSLRGPEVDAVFATANYFPTLGVRPALGRFHTPDEDRLGNGARVVVLSHRLWRTHFAGDTAVLGKTIRMGGDTYTVIGVTPRSFTGVDLQPADLWIPLAAMPQPEWMRERLLDSPHMRIFRAFARVPQGYDVRGFEQRASRRIRELNRELESRRPDTSVTVVLALINVARGPGKPERESLISTRLAGVAAIVLLIACANVVNLFLARAVRRRREIAVRLALGVSRARLTTLLATETLLLALAAGVAALLAAWWAGTLLRTMLVPDAGPASALDARVAAFTLSIALAAGIFAGIVPALQASKPDLTRALKSGAGDGTVHRSRLRNVLVVTQAALSVVLLVGAALFVRSLKNVEGLDIGYDAERLVFGSVEFEKGQAPPDAVVGAATKEIAARLASRPGIAQVALAGIPPMRGFSFGRFFTDTDSSRASSRDAPTYAVVSANYFATVGMRLLRGSTFDDRPGAPRAVVVNDAMAKAVWPGRDPLGRCLYFMTRESPCYTVVGIVETARRGDVIEKPMAQYYFSLGNPPDSGWEAPHLIVRAREGSLAAARAALASALSAAFPTGLPYVRTMTELLEPEYRPWQLGATLFTAFGLLALVVALVGIYSTVSYSVGQRTHEFGVRIALGARLRDVLNQVLGEGLRVVAAGVVVGVALALAAGRLVSAVLYGVEPSDPRAMLLAAGTLLVVAGAAALVPAWRAARVDPNVALRAD
jgi:putative ABC transport system permease protein